MINLTEALIFGLSAWRCAYFVTDDVLPENLRDWFVDKLPGKLQTYIGILLTCIYCLTFWTSIISYNIQEYAIWFVNITAIWGVATYLGVFHNLLSSITQYFAGLTTDEDS